jgi:hypothetical protein
MPTYTLFQEAHWTTWAEHPSGSRHPDIKSYEYSKLVVEFSAKNMTGARKEARRRLELFAVRLPKQYEGSTHGTSAPRLSDPVFAQVHKL